MTYHSHWQRIVYFGGGGSDAAMQPLYFNETWTIDLTGLPQRITMPSAPPARANHVMAYDDQRQRVVLVGGNSSSTGRLTDTWELIGF